MNAVPTKHILTIFFKRYKIIVCPNVINLRTYLIHSYDIFGYLYLFVGTAFMLS